MYAALKCGNLDADECTDKKAMWVHNHKEAFAVGGIDWVEPKRHVGSKGRCCYDVVAEENCRWYQALPDREKHQLHYYDLKQPLQPLTTEDPDEEEFIDLSQNLTRNSVWRKKSPTITPGGKVWMRRRQRWMVGEEKLQFQGLMKARALGFAHVLV